jgi:hypothetical protein
MQGAQMKYIKNKNDNIIYKFISNDNKILMMSNDGFIHCIEQTNFKDNWEFCTSNGIPIDESIIGYIKYKNPINLHTSQILKIIRENKFHYIVIDENGKERHINKRNTFIEKYEFCNEFGHN